MSKVLSWIAAICLLIKPVTAIGAPTHSNFNEGLYAGEICYPQSKVSPAPARSI